MKQKILLVHNYYKQAGGEDTVFQNEAELLKSHGHEVVLYTRNNSEIGRLNVLQKMLLPFSAVFSIKTYCEVKKIIREEKIDLVHVHNTLTMVSPSVFYAAFHCGIPVVQTLHNFRMQCPNGLFYRDDHICEDCVKKGLICSIKHRCYRKSIVQSMIGAAIIKIHRILGTYHRVNFICLTQFNKDKLLLLNGKKQIIDENKVFIKQNFVQVPVSSETSFVQKKEQYLFAGRLDKAKGIHLLLENWDAEYQAQLLICGRGEEEEWCKHYISNHGMHNVKMMGQVSHDRLMELMRESKAVVFPSLLYETFGMSILESYACGTPVLGTMIGNAGELIRECEKSSLSEAGFFPDTNYDLLVKIYQKCGK